VLALLFTARNVYLFSSLGAVPVLLWTITLLLFVVALQSDQFSKISRQLAFLDPTPPYHRDVVEEALFPASESKVESPDVSGAGR
jgi:hypothetical protein